MSQRGRHHRAGGRTTPKGTRPPERRDGARGRGADPFVGDIADRLRSLSPVPLLELASSIVELSTARPTDDLVGRHPSDRSELLEPLALSGLPETAALAWAMLPMLDQLSQAFVRSNVALPLRPGWLAALHDVSVIGTWQLSDVLGDGDNVLIGVRWPQHEATLIVYIDHNVGTLVKDAFVVPESLTATRRHYEELLRREGRADDQSLVPIDPADARARVEEAIQQAQRTVPGFESETWPAVRPLVDWWVSLLPPGGTGYEVEPPTQEERAALADRFVNSSFAARLAAPAAVVREMADTLLWYSGGRGACDPLQWSAVMVEIVLVDFIPRKVVAPREELSQVPEILRALVRFAHHERGIRPGLTAEVEAAIDRWTPQFMELIRTPARPPHERAVDTARALLGPLPSPGIEDVMADTEWRLIAELGGPEALRTLTADPLDDEPFDPSGLPADIIDLAIETSGHLDDLAARVLDGEVRTISRRALRIALQHDPAILRRSVRTPALAAAIVWVVLRMQGGAAALGSHVAVSTQKDLAAAAGVPSGAVSQRATMLLLTLEESELAQARWWHSERRRQALELLGNLARWREERGAAGGS